MPCQPPASNRHPAAGAIGSTRPIAYVHPSQAASLRSSSPAVRSFRGATTTTSSGESASAIPTHLHPAGAERAPQSWLSARRCTTSAWCASYHNVSHLFHSGCRLVLTSVGRLTESQMRILQTAPQFASFRLPLAHEYVKLEQRCVCMRNKRALGGAARSREVAGERRRAFRHDQ